jgi:hypothetical protein
MNPPVFDPSEATADVGCQTGVAETVGAVAGCSAAAGAVAAGDPVCAVMIVPSLEYAPLAMMMQNNNVSRRSFFMDIPLFLEINIEGEPALNVFRIIDVHVVFNPERA